MEGGRRGVPVGPVRRVDLQTPGQRRRATEQLLVEPVPPPPDRLGQGQRRRRRPQRVRRLHTPTAGRPQPDHDSEGDAAPDAEPSLPDLDDVEPAALERLPVGHHVVDARADDAGGHRPHRHGGDVVAPAVARLLQPAPGERHRGDDTEGDHQPVGAQLQRTEVHRAGRRARQEADQSDAEAGDRLRADHEPLCSRAKRTTSAWISSPSWSSVATW